MVTLVSCCKRLFQNVNFKPVMGAGSVVLSLQKTADSVHLRMTASVCQLVATWQSRSVLMKTKQKHRLSLFHLT